VTPQPFSRARSIMPDYGNDVIFRSFITPTNAAPHQVVALAQASEQAGLDLVAFQDHPYQAGFLDTWTPLSYVAAQTERTLRSRGLWPA
jgi:alkanesulfonate monooxygenase SsuD/methylene tetrahydromethanopterin reductase-like flavin-dependent oxidoreductase (luciferase family)